MDDEPSSPSSGTRVVFRITQAKNYWTEDPAFNKGLIAGKTKEYQWTYNTDVVPVYSARYGTDLTNNTIKIEYFNIEVPETALSYMPVNVGTYKVKFTVPGTDNYEGLQDELTFTITRASNSNFITRPGVDGWAWDNYDRTINLFRGRPESGGDVSFAIVNSRGVIIVPYFKLVDANGEHHGDFSSDVYAPQNVIAQLNELPAGMYTLRVSVATYGNYMAFIDDGTTFTITEATNSWDTTPQIETWSRYEWNPEINTPVAVSRYGTPVVEIRRKLADNVYSDEIYYRAIYNRTTGQFDLLMPNLLNTADAGRYRITVNVAGEAGMYTGLPEVAWEFSIYIQGTPDESNFWEITPSIEHWAASVSTGNVASYNLPVGKPVRGRVYFEFFRLNADMTQGDKVVAGIDSVTISANQDANYLQDFYIPTKPGTYYMYAHAVNGNVEADSLDFGPFTLIISNRENTWEQSVNIASLLYLGEYASWEKPTAKANLWDSTYRYEYYTSTGEFVGTEIPTKPGKYVVRAYADARYSNAISSEMPFEVRLSKNYWEKDTSPTIESWSEELNGTAPSPVGKAAIGGTIFIYLDADTREELPGKPTKAGNYILVARAELGEADGYEVLEAEYEFTIAPAFDPTLVTICTILGALASVLTVVAIIFAVRRNREN